MKTIILRTEESLKVSKVILSYYLAKLSIPLSLKISAHLAAKVWFTPLRASSSFYRISSPVKPKLERLKKYPDIQKQTFQASNDPQGTVLLIHGWAGSSRQFEKILNELLTENKKVVCFDFPGHGISRGFSTDIWEMRNILLEIVDSLEGKIDVICHSFGLLVLSQMAHLVPEKIDKIVSISSPVKFDFLVNQFLRKTKLNSRVRNNFLESIQERVYPFVKVTQDIDIKPDLFSSGKWLFIHDENDKEVPMDEFHRLKHLNPSAETFITKGKGHNRILSAPEVIQQVLAHFSTTK